MRCLSGLRWRFESSSLSVGLRFGKSDGSPGEGYIRFLLYGLVLSTLLAALAAHVVLGGGEMGVTGPVLVLDQVFDVALAVGMLVMCIGLGSGSLRRVHVSFQEPVETIVFSATCGVGLVATAMLALSLVFGVNWLSMGAVLAGLAWACRGDIASAPALVIDATLQVLRVSRSPRLRLVSTCGFGALVVTLVGLSLAPPVDWDTLAYHLEVPRSWLAAGHIFLPPDNYHTAFVGLQHMLYLPLLGAGSMAAPAVLNALLAVLAGFATFALARDLYGERTGAIAHWLFWANPLILLVAITPRVDVTLVLYLLVAFHALAKALRSPMQPRMLWLAAALMGMAVGVKYVALGFALVLAPLFLIGNRRIARASGRGMTRPALAVLLAGIVAAAPWIVKNWLLIGAPFYPFLARPRVEPWLARLYGSEFVPASIILSVHRVLEQIREPFSVLDLFWRPWHLMVDPGSQYSAPSLALLLVLFSPALPRRRITLFLVVPALVFAGIVLLEGRQTNLRYLLPAMPFLLIVAAALIVHATRFSGDAGSWFVVVCLTLLLAPTAQAVAARVKESPTMSFLAGRTSRAGYLRDYWESASYMPAVEWANQHLPRTSLTLGLYEPRRFYFKFRALGDVSVTNWPLVEPFARPPTCLRDAGITHVMVNDAAVKFYSQRGMKLDQMHWGRFEAYRRYCLDLLYRDHAFSIYRVTPAGASKGVGAAR